MDDTKICSACNTVLSVQKFHRDRNRRGGLARICKACNKAKARDWYEKNRERAVSSRLTWYRGHREYQLEKFAAYRVANRERLVTSQRAWRTENLDRKRANDLHWQKQNQDKVRLYHRVSESRRRAAKRSCVGSHTAAQINNLYQLQHGRCACCKVDIVDSYHQDHIVALSAGGDDSIHNIQLLCKPCNMSKHTKDPISFMQERGFLL